MSYQREINILAIVLIIAIIGSFAVIGTTLLTVVSFLASVAVILLFNYALYRMRK
jgi:hypothetical protein